MAERWHSRGKAIAKLWRSYGKATAKLWRGYYKATATLVQSYDKSMTMLWQSCGTAISPIEKLPQRKKHKASSRLWHSYGEAKAKLCRGYVKAIGELRRIWSNSIEPLWPSYGAPYATSVLKLCRSPRLASNIENLGKVFRFRTQFGKSSKSPLAKMVGKKWTIWSMLNRPTGTTGGKKMPNGKPVGKPSEVKGNTWEMAAEKQRPNRKVMKLKPTNVHKQIANK